MSGYKEFGDCSKAHWRMAYAKKGWMRPVVLSILEKEPMNGIDLINRINERSHGLWKPSPGSIYPLLQSLTEEKIAKKRKDGKYELTEKYKKEFGLADETASIISNVESDISYLEEISKYDKEKYKKYKNKIDEIKRRISKLK